ncbi:MauE/DoxX family redox-associated membrane protein [Chitinophaga sp.]|uniref:MauE/DoxX family redox-associated membrane protein n=1 Tax=Chitinophaga sp. TaxID=1869181 RepID=UPI002F92CC02
MSRKRVIEIMVALLILLFAYTGVSKLLDYTLFKNMLRLPPWSFPATIAGYIAALLPAGLLSIAIMLLIPSLRLKGLWLSLFTLLAFTVAIAILFLSGASLPCSCNGVFAGMSWEWHALFNAAFILLTIITIGLYKLERWFIQQTTSA